MQSIRIAPLDYHSAEQRDALVELLASYADDPAAGSGDGLSSEARASVIAGLRDHPKSLVLMAFDGGTPVGVAVCFEGYGTFAARPLINLHDLVVAPTARGRGVGGRLLEAVEAEARRRGCCFVTLEVSGQNTGAQRLYRRHGFVGGASIDPPHAMMFWKKPLA
ncbi:MAG: GNAT family N-acetyltransferase [Planctomycetota bacterium]